MAGYLLYMDVQRLVPTYNKHKLHIDTVNYR
jgi:hypothetical protein